MKQKRLTITVVLFLSIIAFAIAQIPSSSPPSPAHYFPGGALAYVETPNLKGLLSWWRDSEFRANWEKSKDYEAFKDSRLYLKLQKRIGEWGSQGNFNLSFDRLVSLS